MLNETWRLWQAIDRIPGIRVEAKHKRIQEPGRSSPCLRVRLNDAGRVVAVEEVSPDEWPTWTVMEGNQNSFPVVRVQEPLFDIPRDMWTRLGYEPGRRRKPPLDAERLKLLQDVPHTATSCIWSKKSHTLWTRLRDQKATELVKCGRSGSPAVAVVAELGDRFCIGARTPGRLFSEIVEAGLAALIRGTITSIAPVEQLLVGKGPPDKAGARPAMTVQLAFDLESAGESRSLLFSTATRNELRRCLPTELRRRTSTIGTDALTGQSVELESKTLPKVELPMYSSNRDRIARKRFPLASMFSAARCNYRYGLTDARVFPVGKERAIRLKEALEFITADHRLGQTWDFVGSGRFESVRGRKTEKPDLFVAYVEECPDLDAKTARYVAGGIVQQEQTFEVNATALVQALKGVVKQHPSARLQLFVVREVSKGQAQVVLAESPTVKEVMDAAERWVAAVNHNLPRIRLCLREENQDGEMKCVLMGRPLPPYPEQVVRLLSHQWVRAGDQSSAVVGPQLGEVLSLMLRTEGRFKAARQRLLDLLIQQLSPLLLGVFGAMHASRLRATQNTRERLFDVPRSLRETALCAVAVLGILLDAHGRQWRIYMNETAFQLGRLLALADTLHREYCVHMRKGSIPPQLIGSSLMATAAHNPQDSIDRLRSRLNVYQAWATTSEGEKYRLAKWAVGQIGQICHRIRRPLPTHADQVFRAELFLGYMARSPKDTEPSPEDNDDE